MVICVLLNDAAICTYPCGTTRRSRFFLNSFLRFVAAAGFAGAPVSGAVPAAFGSFSTFHSDRAISLKLCQAGAQHCCAPTNLYPFLPTVFFFVATSQRLGPLLL